MEAVKIAEGKEWIGGEGVYLAKRFFADTRYDVAFIIDTANMGRRLNAYGLAWFCLHWECVDKDEDTGGVSGSIWLNLVVNNTELGSAEFLELLKGILADEKPEIPYLCVRLRGEEEIRFVNVAGEKDWEGEEESEYKVHRAELVADNIDFLSSVSRLHEMRAKKMREVRIGRSDV